MSEETARRQDALAPDAEEKDPKLKELKARAQLTKASVKLGHDGVSERFLQILNEALNQHELVKVKFAARKDEKKHLSREIEQRSDSLMVQRVGHTATYYRAKSKT
jgi:RNA-binding protein